MNEQIDAIDLKAETDRILSELSGRIEYHFLMEQQAKAKAVESALAQVKFKWLERIIENAAKGDNVEYLASQLGILETGDYLQEGFDGPESLWCPAHIVNHAIVQCKQAIANKIKYKWDPIDGEWRNTTGNMIGQIWIFGGEYNASIWFLDRNCKEVFGSFLKLEDAQRACEDRIAFLLPTNELTHALIHKIQANEVKNEHD